jgi:hypothetical protein
LLLFGGIGEEFIIPLDLILILIFNFAWGDVMDAEMIKLINVKN